MIRKYIIVADDSVKGFDEGIAKLEREWGAEELKPCEDVISRQAVIDAIAKIHPIDTEYDCTLYDKLDVRYVLMDLPSVTPWSDWIPVSEKLPEPLTAVLLTVRYKSSGCLTYQMGYWEGTLEKWERWLEIGTLDDEFEILAWMELPEKYEEDTYE